jgi:hypothetical protein
MSDAPRNAWQCPTCGRQIPRSVEVCRCGSERKRLEALGYKFEQAPPPTPAAAARKVHARTQTDGPAAALIGYQIDTVLGPVWRVILKTLIVAAVLAAGGALVVYTHTEPLPTRGNVEVLESLEDFTRRAGPDAPNTIPAFLASGGQLGVFRASGEDDDPIPGVSEPDLRLGFCSMNVARQVRHEYPGYYEDWPDQKLVRTVLEKYPEYADRLCTLSIRLEATASEVVKYRLKPRTLVGHAGLWLRTLLLTSLVALLLLNLYYRGIVARLADSAGA